MTLVLLSGLSAGVLQDAHGNVIAGRQVNVYARGTSTPVQVYADSAGSSPLTQPVTTDSSGQVPGYVAGGVSVDIVDVLTGLRDQGEPVLASGVAAATLPITSVFTLEQVDPLAGTAGHDCAAAWATVAGLASAPGSSAYGRAVIRLLPSKKYETTQPFIVPGASASGVSLEGTPRSTTIAALAPFNAGINGANHLVKNWVDADYSGAEKAANPTTYASVPPATVGTSLAFYASISGLNIDASPVSGLNPLGWSSPQETSLFQNLIFHGAGGAVAFDIGGAMNGTVTIKHTVVYGGNGVWLSELRCKPASGSDLYVSDWTTGAGKHAASVFDVTGVNIHLDHIHSEAYVDPAVGAGPAIFNLNCVGVTLDQSFVSLANFPGLNHPLIQTINPHGSSFSYSSPRITGLECFITGTTSWNVPWINDSAQSGNIQQLVYAGESFISSYDGSTYSYTIATGAGAVKSLRGGTSLPPAGAIVETVDRAVAGITKTLPSGTYVGGRLVIPMLTPITKMGYFTLTASALVTNLWAILTDPNDSNKVVAVSNDLLATQQFVIATPGQITFTSFKGGGSNFAPPTTAQYDVSMCAVFSSGTAQIASSQGVGGNVAPVRGTIGATGQTGPPALAATTTALASSAGVFTLPYMWVG